MMKIFSCNGTRGQVEDLRSYCDDNDEAIEDRILRQCSRRKQVFVSQCELRQSARTEHKQIKMCFIEQNSLVRQDVSTHLSR